MSGIRCGFNFIIASLSLLAILAMSHFNRALAQDASGQGAGVDLLPWILALVAVVALVGLALKYRADRSKNQIQAADLNRQISELKATAEAAPVCRIIVLSEDGKLVLGPKARDLLGAETEQFSPEEFAALFQPDDQEEAMAALNSLSREGASFDLMLKPSSGRRTVRLRCMRASEGRSRELWLDNATLPAQAIADARDVQKALEELLDHLPYPVWRRNQDLALDYGNAAFHRMVDLPLKEGRRPERELNSAARALAARAVKLGLTQSESQQLVIDGQRRLYDLSEAPLPDGSTFGFALDQTALEETQSELSRHVAAHDDVLQSLGTGIVIFGPDQRLKFFNAAYRDLFEMDSQFLRTEPTIDEVLDELRERRQLAEQADFRSFKQEFARNVMSTIAPTEELMHTPAGRTFRMVSTPHPFGGVILTYEDVTDRLALEASYNTLIEVQRESIDQLYEGIAVFGSDGRLKLYNPSFMRLWELSEESLAGQPHVSKIIDQVAHFFEGRRDWPDLRDRIVSEVTSRESRNLRIDRDDKRIIDVAAIPLPDGGRLYKYTDVTDTINMERALRERNEALIAADRLKSEFIANVSYEFRTPLNAIIGYSELLSRQYFGSLNPKQLEYASSILDAAQTLLMLISDVIDVAAIEAGYITLDRRPTRIKAVLETIERLFQQRARNRDIAFTISCAENIGEIEGDEQRLKQAFSNLVSNAIAVAPFGGEVAMVAERDTSQVTITVDVRGPDNEIQAIGPGGTGRDVTSGLGIALVKTLVELHGGSVKTETGFNRRCVRCSLPLSVAAMAPVGSA